LFADKYSELMKRTNEFKERSGKEIPKSYLPIEYILDHYDAIIQYSKKKGEEKQTVNTLSSTKRESLN